MRQQIIDTKINSHAFGEADECLFEYLHTEMVNYTLSKTFEKKVTTYIEHATILNDFILPYSIAFSDIVILRGTNFRSSCNK